MKTNKFKLLLGCGALLVLGAASLQGCSSSDDSSTSTGGTGGSSTGGTASGGKGGSGTAGKTSTGGTTGTAGTGTAGTGTAGTSAGGTSAAGTSGSEGGEPGAAGASGDDQTAICAKFCADEATVCTDTLKQYADTPTCLSACALFARGTVGDTTGDTLDCRVYHLNAAATISKTTHCPHTSAMPATGTPCTGAAP